MDSNHLGFCRQVRENKHWQLLQARNFPLQETGGFPVAKMKVSFSAFCHYPVSEWHTLCGTILNIHITLPQKKGRKKTQSPIATFRSELRGPELAHGHRAASRQDELLDCIALQKTQLPSEKQTTVYPGPLLRSSSRKSRHQRLSNKVAPRQVQRQSKQELFKVAHVSATQNLQQPDLGPINRRDLGKAGSLTVRAVLRKDNHVAL